MIEIDGFRYKEKDARKQGLLRIVPAEITAPPQHYAIPAPAAPADSSRARRQKWSLVRQKTKPDPPPDAMKDSS